MISSGRQLDLMSVGDEEVRSLGGHPERTRYLLIVAASLATAAAVAVSGLIGFVGIIVPHTVRLLAGSSYRQILPLSALFGAAFMMLADLAARTVVAPNEVPIGVITALFGAPVLRRRAAYHPPGHLMPPSSEPPHTSPPARGWPASPRRPRCPPGQ